MVPFRNKKVLGIVAAEIYLSVIHNQDKTKPVIEFIDKAPAFFLDLLLWLGNYYYTSPAFFFSIMTPRFFTLKRNEAEVDNLAGLKYRELSAPSSILNVIKETIQSQSVFVNTSNFTIMTQIIIYVKLIQAAVQKNKSVLFLAPTISQAKSISHYLPSSLKSNLIVLTHELYRYKARYFNIWRKILSNDKPLIVIGTRSAVFAPLFCLGLIIIHESESNEYKQYDQNPRYDARTVALKIAELTNSSIRMFSDGVLEYALR